MEGGSNTVRRVPAGFHQRVSTQKGVPAAVPGAVLAGVVPLALFARQATVDVWPQLVQRDQLVAEPQARGGRGSVAASVVDTMSIGWQARYVVAWPAGAATTPWVVAELMFQSRQTPWCKVLELNVVRASQVKAVCTFPVQMKGAQGKKRADVMFGVGKGLHRSWSYQMYHKEDRWSVWYGLRGLRGVGGDEVPRYVLKAFAAWVKECKDS